jgi:hypothetical protein
MYPHQPSYAQQPQFQQYAQLQKSRLTWVSFVLAVILPAPLAVGLWVFTVSVVDPTSNTLALAQILLDILVGFIPLCGGILGIIALVLINNKSKAYGVQTRGKGLAITSIVVGFIFSFFVLPIFYIVLLLEYLTVNHVG